MCVIVGLSSLNYADVIPQAYTHISMNLLTSLSQDERFDAVQKVREGLTKSLGIVGAARTGNALRILANCTPKDLMLKESPRSQESEEKAILRGNEFFSRVYDKNPLFDKAETERASPDYMLVVKGTTLPSRIAISRSRSRISQANFNQHILSMGGFSHLTGFSMTSPRHMLWCLGFMA